MKVWWAYTSVYVFGILATYSFRHDGLAAWSVPLFAFVVVPALDLIMGPSSRQIKKEERQLYEKKKSYDILLYLILPLQYFCLFDFLNHNVEAEGSALAGRLVGMGILCGVLGINVAHELGHRQKKYEQWMAKLLLITSGYGHFFIEHNRGHHRRIGTMEDPVTARKNETLYRFWLRAVLGSYRSAWQIENQSRRNKGLKVWHFSNEMVQLHLLQFAFWGLISLIFGLKGLLLSMAAAVIGILLLEAIDYIEHYGLMRKEIKPGIYERVNASHSWNSDHLAGRLLLFELSLHADHHMNSSIKYQALSSHEDAPKLPTGYPGSVLMALIPPLWFRVTHAHLARNQIQDDVSV